MRKNRDVANKRVVSTLLIAVLAVVIGVVIGLTMRGRSSGGGMRLLPIAGKHENNLTRGVSLINRMYVDSLNLDSLSNAALATLLEELDPHSVFIPIDEMQQANEGLEGEFDGIGIVFNMSTDTVLVMSVIRGGPSDRAGLRNGDRVVMVGDSTIAGQKIKQTDIMKMLRGPRGTVVDVSLMRQGVEELIPVTITRGVIPIKSLDAAFMIRPEMGYIKFSMFSATTYIEVLQALVRLRGEGMKSLILDLRGNSGGFLEQAILVGNEFIPESKMIVYTEDREKNRAVQYSNGKGNFTDIKLAILIDDWSASASEILAGAVQDNDRGVVIGRRSYGKGLVQQQFAFDDGSAMRLTVARYYTPAGRSIQRPYDGGKGDVYRSELIRRYEHQEFFDADSIAFNSELEYKTAGGRTVYGGGGIMPDIFIPLDTTRVTDYYSEVFNKNILYNYTIRFADRHRDELNSIKSVEQVNAFLDHNLNLQEFIDYASEQGVKPNRSQINSSREILIAQLRANIARNSELEDVGFYSNIYRVDSSIMSAIEFIESGRGLDDLD